MARQEESLSTYRRRKLLQLTGAAAGGTFLSALGGTTFADSHTYVLQQGDECVPLTPIQGDEPVEEFYDYTYPKDRFLATKGSDGTSYSSEGTLELQEENTSILFLYDGPEGLSLVIVHGRVDEDEVKDSEEMDGFDEEDETSGESEGTPEEDYQQAEDNESSSEETETGTEDGDTGTEDGDTEERDNRKRTVTFAIDGLPKEGIWAVADDYYLTKDGEQAESNYDRWDVDSSVHTVHWAYRGGRTDGGAFRGLGDDFEVEIEPAFNEEAGLADEHNQAPIEEWKVLSGDREDPDTHSLDQEEDVMLTTGECPEDGGSMTGADEESTEEESTDEETESEETPTESEETGSGSEGQNTDSGVDTQVIWSNDS